MPIIPVTVYILFISAATCFITVYDKLISKRRSGTRRISEKTLLFCGVMGGSVAEYITMLLIRHKTKHLKFMLGLPAIIVGQTVLLVLCHIFLFRS